MSIGTIGKAAVLTRPGEINIEFIETPNIKSNEVLVQVLNVSLCGSDYKLYNGQHPNQPKYALILGHEWVGKILKKGEAVQDLAVNDIVTGDCSLYCNQCPMCSINKNLCADVQKFGITCHGALREWLVIPARFLYKVPPEIPIPLASITEPIAVAIQAVKDLDVRDKKVIVTGGGIIGLATTITLHAMGALVSLVEIDYDRRLLLKELLNERAEIRETIPKENFQLAVEASGRAECVEGLIKVLSPTGNLILIGHPDCPVIIKPVVGKMLRIQGSIGGTGSFIEAFQLLSQERSILQKTLCFFPFEEVGSVLNCGNSDFKNALKVTINIGGR